MNQPVSPAALPAEGEIFDGKYRIGPKLGVGGMAAVLSATHLGLDEKVALKLLLPECSDDPGVVERFLQEGRTAIKIRSEHVVRMLDVGMVDGQAYLVMEYLAGKDLDALVRTGGPVPVAAAVDMLLQACEAIGEAHKLGIVHRDLKPANLFLTHRADGSPCVKVLDFGISKRPTDLRRSFPTTDSHPTLPSTVMGSPQYMAPEQMLSAKAAEARSDIWSLGAVLYELLSGKLAFNGDTMGEVCARVLNGVPVPLADLREGIPEEIRAAVDRCFAKKPEDRFANVAELAKALAPFGTEGARASAESIARVVEGSVELAVATPWNGSGTLKPTAAEILGTDAIRRPKRSGFVVGGLLAAAAVAVVVGNVVPRFGALRGVAAAAAAVAPPAPAAEPEPLTKVEPTPPVPSPAGRAAALMTGAAPASVTVPGSVASAGGASATGAAAAPASVAGATGAASGAGGGAARVGTAKVRVTGDEAPRPRFTAIPPTKPTIEGRDSAEKESNPYDAP